MNHVHRVRLKMIFQPLEDKGLPEENTEEYFSVVVKTAPREVRVSAKWACHC